MKEGGPESMIERCPNCGAPVRAGAKFCTTCGLRLPEIQVETPVAVEESVVAPSAAPAPAGCDVYASWASGSPPARDAADASERNGTIAPDEEVPPEQPAAATEGEAIPMPEGGDPFRGWPSWVNQSSVTGEWARSADTAPEAAEAAPEGGEAPSAASAEPEDIAEQEPLEAGPGPDEAEAVAPQDEESAEILAPVAEAEAETEPAAEPAIHAM